MNDAPTKNPEQFALADAGLHIRDGNLLRVDTKGNSISSIPLSSITDVKCRRIYHIGTFFFSICCLWIAYLLNGYTQSWGLKWIVSGLVFLVGFFALVGGVIEHEMEVSTTDGKLRFAIVGDIRDAQAFAMTLLQLRRSE